jgi:hypothetical protein
MEHQENSNLSYRAMSSPTHGILKNKTGKTPVAGGTHPHLAGFAKNCETYVIEEDKPVHPVENQRTG